MKTMSNQDIVVLITAFLGGREVHVRVPGGFWMACPDPQWNFQQFEYRLVPEPITGWVGIYAGGKLSTGIYKSEEECHTMCPNAEKAVKLIEAP